MSKHEEHQYLDLLLDTCINGVWKDNRTANRTRSKFGNMMRFNLTRYEDDKKIKVLPLITTKNMIKNAELIFKELEFFIRGETNTKILEDKGVGIWKQNTSREFLDKVGLTKNKEGDAGEIYGFQWRHFGAEYQGCDSDYTGKGLDQLAKVIEEIKTNPGSRRLIVTAWNPLKLNNMCLPPCHMMYQFNCRQVNGVEKLDILLYQRSADLPLGVPFNIASYATLLHVIAELTGREAGELIYTTADTHVYEDQIYLAAAQINRKPYPFPELIFNKNIKNIDEFTADICEVKNYQCWPLIQYPFST